MRRDFLAAAAFTMTVLTASAPSAHAQDGYAAFIVGLRDVCANEPARACTGQVVSFLDSDRDARVSLREFETVRSTAQTSVRDRASGLSPIERNLTAVGLLTLQQAKLATVFANFDANGDGGLSEDELFADFKLDQRPLAEIISDPDGVDWNSFTARFGKFGFLVRDLLPPAYRK